MGRFGQGLAEISGFSTGLLTNNKKKNTTSVNTHAYTLTVKRRLSLRKPLFLARKPRNMQTLYRQSSLRFFVTSPE